MDKKLDIHVFSHGMHQMIAALSITVAIARKSKYRHLMICKPDPCGNGKTPAVKPIEGITFEIVRELGGLTYA
jgi:hypothetical protein